MTLQAADVSVTIVARRSAQGHPFSEILYRFPEGDAERFALTRVWYAIDDGPFARTREAQAFVRRRE